jgi:ketosteroid isomerase-like protein
MRPVEYVLLCALAVGVPAALAHPPSITTGAQEEAFADEIKAWRKMFSEAAANKKMRRLDAFYTATFVHTDAEGKLTGKADRLAKLAAGEPVVETLPAERLSIRVPGGWTAIATGRAKLRSAGAKSGPTLAWTVVYVRAGEGWQIAAIQEALIQDGKP